MFQINKSALVLSLQSFCFLQNFFCCDLPHFSECIFPNGSITKRIIYLLIVTPTVTLVILAKKRMAKFWLASSSVYVAREALFPE